MSNQTVVFLRNFNRWRRGEDGFQQPCPRVVGSEIDAACDQIQRLERECANWRAAATQAVADRDANKAMADELSAEAALLIADQCQKEDLVLKYMGEADEWRECAERLATILRDADVLATNATEDGRRDWHGDIGWLRGKQTAIVIGCPPEEALAEFDRLKEASK